MQYALLMLDESKDITALVDANEIQALRSGLDAIREPVCLDESEMVLRVVYGCYKPQMTHDFPKSEVKRHIEDAVGKWMVHFDGLNQIRLGIEDIVVYDNVVLTASCSHSEQPHASDDIAFAALVLVPPEFTFNQLGQAKTAFLRWADMDPLTNILNRLGLFAFGSEEKRYKSEPTKANWRERIDQRRAINKAQKVR